MAAPLARILGENQMETFSQELFNSFTTTPIQAHEGPPDGPLYAFSGPPPSNQPIIEPDLSATQPASLRHFWSIQLQTVLVEAYTKAASAGLQSDSGFKPEAHKLAAEACSALAGYTIKREKAKSKLSALKMEYKIWQHLAECSGVSADYETGRIYAPDDVWDRYLEKHKKATRYQTICLLNASLLHGLFFASYATGKHAGNKESNSSQTPSFLASQPTTINLTTDAVTQFNETDENEQYRADTTFLAPASSIPGATAQGPRLGGLFVPSGAVPKRKKVTGGELLGKSLEKAISLLTSKPKIVNFKEEAMRLF